MSNQEENVNDLLDRATQNLRDVKAPAGPPADLVSAALTALGEYERQLSRRSKMKLIAKYSAAAIVLIAIGVLVTFTQSSQAAFSAVLEKVQQAHSAKFDVTSTFVSPATGKPTTGHITLTILDDRMRQEVPEGTVMIIDGKAGGMLMLNTREKKAMLVKTVNSARQMSQQNLLEKFRKMPVNAGKPVGKKQIGGQEVDGYLVKHNGKEMTVYADPTTHLPVRIETLLDIPMAPKSEIVMDNFQWDVPVNEADFSLQPPAGYAVQEFAFNGAKATEADLVATLRSIAESNNGKFPDALNYSAIIKSLGGAKRPATGQGPDKATMQRAMAITRGLSFISKQNGEDFHYAGKGVSLNEKDRAIFWYRPTGSANYRVINADLSVREVTRENLPTIESQAVSSIDSPTQSQVTTPASVEGLSK